MLPGNVLEAAWHEVILPVKIDTRPETDKPRSVKFGLPIVLLLILLAALTIGLLQIAVHGQDRVAREASETIARAAFHSQRESLEKLVRDYSFWNESVQNLVFTLDAAWIQDNLVWMVDNFGVSRIFVFGPEDKPIYASLAGETLDADSEAWRNPGLVQLIETAGMKPDDAQESASAYVRFSDGLHLVAASKLLEESDTSGHPPYPDKGILVVTRKIDREFLSGVEKDFQLPGLNIGRQSPAAADRAVVELRGSDGKAAAHASWSPAQPGTRLLEWLILPLALAFVLVGGVIAMIAVRARRAGAALQQAFEDRVAAQTQLEYSARHDSLTDLANRALFLEHLTTAMAHAERYGSGFTLHYLDLDGFKDVNDTLGHPAGDQLLRGLAARLRGAVRAADTIARFGGDEFAVLQRSTADRGDAGRLAERMIRAVAEPFEIDGHHARVTLSVGIAFDTSGEDPEKIIRNADRALYRAKEAGGNRFEFYDADLAKHAAPRKSRPARRDSGALTNG